MTPQAPRFLYGVLGQPLAQSMSPALHTWGFARSGHPGAYFAWNKGPAELAAFLAAARSLPVHGLSVTIPHKQAIIPHLDELTPRARAVGAVNLVYWRDASAGPGAGGESADGWSGTGAGSQGKGGLGADRAVSGPASLASVEASVEAFETSPTSFLNGASPARREDHARPDAGCPNCGHPVPEPPTAASAMTDTSALAGGTEWRLVGDNTDVAGFLAPLLPIRGALPPRVLLLGAGGAARAVLAGLRELGLEELHVTARSREKTESLCADFGCSFVPWERREAVLAGTRTGTNQPLAHHRDPAQERPDQDQPVQEHTAPNCPVRNCPTRTGREEPAPWLVVNATPLGMRGSFEGQSPLPGLLSAASGEAEAMLPPGSVVYDIVYNPIQTPLLASAASLGLCCIDGLDFFVAQGLEQFRRWTGIELPRDEARALLAARLDNRLNNGG